MRGIPRKAGTTTAVVLLLAGVLTMGTAQAAVAEHLPDDRAEITAYLQSLGVDLSTVVWQESLRNYAGPSCPGSGWNCVRANRPIVQLARPGGTNLFYCTAPNCLVIQVVTSGPGSNASACERRQETTSGETIMVCHIVQVNGQGTNSATISQHIQQTQGLVQRAREIARIDQENETRSNIARIIQGIGQTSRAKGDTQIQEAHQAASVNQTTASDDPDANLGNNTSNIRQTQDQLQRASGTGLTDTLTQSQNTDPGSDLACDQPEDATYDQQKNQCAVVTQHSGVINIIDPFNPVLAPGGGDNRSTLNHQISQRQVAGNAGTITQNQGFSSTGEGGLKEQFSAGVSTGQALQDMLQVQTAPTNVTVVQDQATGDPRCCWLQFGNEANRADITQTTNQMASSPFAFQEAVLQGDCDSSGVCHLRQSATTNFDNETNECTASSCHEQVVCFGGIEGDCSSGGID
jgi:hypothetical protein